MTTYSASTEAEIETAIAAAVGGDVIEVADGTYANMTLNTVGRSGTAGNPILMRAVNRHAVIVTGTGNLAIRSSYFEVDGFRFEVTTDNCVRLANACTGSAVRNCYFYQCGSVSTTLGNVRIEAASNSNTVEGCVFDDSNQIGVRIDIVTADLCQRNRIIGNTFKDANLADGVCIQLGQDTTDQVAGYTTVRHNVFDNCFTGSELISNKTDYNNIDDNLVLNCTSPITLRGGAFCTLNRNVITGGDSNSGIRVFGHDHEIIGNLIYGFAGTGIKLYCGDSVADGAAKQAAQDCLIAGNTIYGCSNGIRVNGDYVVTTNEALPACDISANLLIANTANDYVVVEQADGNTLTENTTGSDPGFLDAANDDFRLDAPITAAKWWTGETPHDHDGRRYFQQPSRGAYEVYKPQGAAVQARVKPAGVDTAKAKAA